MPVRGLSTPRWAGLRKLTWLAPFTLGSHILFKPRDRLPTLLPLAHMSAMDRCRPDSLVPRLELGDVDRAGRRDHRDGLVPLAERDRSCPAAAHGDLDRVGRAGRGHIE